MNIKIVTAEQLPDQIETLATLARKEGYNLVDKLFRNNRINLSTIGEKSSQYLGTRFSDEVNLENIGYLISYNENICKKNKELI